MSSVNPPQLLNAALAATPAFSATMLPGIPIGGGGGSYILPPATSTTLGGVKIGANISVTPDGTISVAAPGSGAVASVFGRTGSVVATPGDYTAAQVTNAVDKTQVYSDPSWIGSLGYSKLTGVPSNVSNAVDATGSYSNPSWLASLPWSKITGAPAFLVSPLTTKGDLLGYGSAPARIPVGVDGQVLIASSASPNGVTWATPGTGNVTSVFARTGVVAAATGDYTAAQVTNAVDQTQTYSNPSWLTTLIWSKITSVPNNVTFAVDSTGSYTNPPWLVSIPYSKLTAVPSNVANAVDSTGSYSDPSWLTGLNWSKLVGSPSSAQIAVFQTPWLQDINAATFRLLNVAQEGIGFDLSTNPMVSPGTILYVGGGPANSGVGRVMVGSTQSSGAFVGEFSFANYNTAGTEKRQASIQSYCVGSSQGDMRFYVATGAAPIERMRIYAGGIVSMGTNIVPNEYLNVWGNSAASAGFEVVNQNGGGGSIFLRCGLSNVNYIQSGNQSGGGAQDLRFANVGASTVWMTIQASTGNVGIGTTLAYKSLDVRSSFMVGNTDFNNSTVGSALWIDLGASSGNTYSRIQAFTAGSSVNGLLAINPLGGNVGIGTTSPSNLLDVATGAVTVRGATAAATVANVSILDYSGGNTRLISVGPTTTTYSGIQLVLTSSNGSNTIIPLIIGSDGSIAMGNLPSANPGAGSKKLWYDTTDSNRVKFAA